MPPHAIANAFKRLAAGPVVSRTGGVDASSADRVHVVDDRHAVIANAKLHNLRLVDTITTADKQPAAVDADGRQRGGDDGAAPGR